VQILTAEEIGQRLSGVKRGVVPSDCSHVTAFVDIGERLLNYVVCAWTADFRGYVIDYGTEPDQGRRFYGYRDCPKPLASVYKGGPDAVILAGLEALTDRLLSTDWPDEKNGPPKQVSLLLFDNGYGPFTETGYRFALRSPHRARLKPSKGVATRVSRGEFRRTDAIRRGPGWAEAVPQGRKDRLLEFDANLWKTTTHARLSTEKGDAGSLTLFDAKPHEHELFAQHLTAEKPTRVTANGRTADEWNLRPGRENHWLDCLVGNAVAASVLGCVLPGQAQAPSAGKKRIKLSEVQAARRGRR
ncbi:MAG TPA: terminase gpA endonuclease subunit, partial [Planctomycetaceae bacterium]